ncbi:MAG: UDP-N-acetylenolpyruvoylglucosamine reductase, partial [Neofamilia sp.]
MLFEDIKNLDIGEVLKGEPMSAHTTFRIGGPADVFVVPKDVGALIKLLKYLREKEIKPFILGQGSNLLVSEKGMRGVVI